MLHTNAAAMVFPNAVYGWLIMSGMVEQVERRSTLGTSGAEALTSWQVHPRNVMNEPTADMFLGAFDVIQRMDRALMRNIARYSRLLGGYYAGNTLTSEDVLALVDATLKGTSPRD